MACICSSVMRYSIFACPGARSNASPFVDVLQGSRCLPNLYCFPSDVSLTCIASNPQNSKAMCFDTDCALAHHMGSPHELWLCVWMLVERRKVGYYSLQNAIYMNTRFNNPTLSIQIKTLHVLFQKSCSVAIHLVFPTWGWQVANQVGHIIHILSHVADSSFHASLFALLSFCLNLVLI